MFDFVKSVEKFVEKPVESVWVERGETCEKGSFLEFFNKFWGKTQTFSRVCHEFCWIVSTFIFRGQSMVSTIST